MNLLSKFLRSTIKGRGMKIDTFIKKASLSRSTFYRIINGLQKPTPESVARICRALDLTEKEQAEFEYCCDISMLDSDTVEAHNLLCDLLYPVGKPQVRDIDMIYSDGDRYMRTYRQVIDAVCKLAGEQDAVTSIHILNCCDHSILLPLRELVCRLERLGAGVTLEHIIESQSESPASMVRAITYAIDTLALDCSTVRFSESDGSGGRFMRDIILIGVYLPGIGTDGYKRFFHFNFLEDELSLCYATSEPNVADFFTRSYHAVRSCCVASVSTQSVAEMNTIDNISTQLFNCYSDCDTLLSWPTPCDIRVPVEAFVHMRERVSNEAKFAFVRSFMQVSQQLTEQAMDSIMNSLFDFLHTRYTNSLKNTNIDVCSADGLRQFARTGYLGGTDSPYPTFDAEEIRMILTSMRDRSTDPDDRYTLYILRGRSHSDTLIHAFADSCVLLEIPSADGAGSRGAFLMNPDLASLIFSFARDYVPSKLALTADETYAFLTELIGSVE